MKLVTYISFRLGALFCAILNPLIPGGMLSGQSGLPGSPAESIGSVSGVSPSGNPYLDEELVPRIWPATPRPLFTATQAFEMVEMQSLPRLHLGGPVNLQLGDLYNFRPSSTSLPRYSAYFRHAAQPEALIGFSLFTKAEFLPDLRKESLMGYAKSLFLFPLSPTTEVRMLTGPEQPLPRKAFAFMGFKPVMMTYVLTDPVLELNLQRTEYFLDLGSTILVVTIEAPPALFGGVFVLARQLLAEATLLE